jgi:hypothetical protein
MLTASPISVVAQPVVYPGAPAVLPAYEILTIVRSVGLEPLGRPVRSGETYSLRAMNPAGQVVAVLVHARMGRILRIAPATRAAGFAPPNPIPYPPAPSMVPDGYGPNSRIAAYPPDATELPFAERNPEPPSIRSAKPSSLPLPRSRPAQSPMPPRADATASPNPSAIPKPNAGTSPAEVAAPATPENPSAILE